MILSTKGNLAKKALEGDYGKGFPNDLVKRTKALFAVLDAVVELKELNYLPGKKLEKLTGDRNEQYSIRINDQWRICFEWTQNGPTEVEITNHYKS